MEYVKPGTERAKQLEACRGPYVRRWHYICDDGENFSAIAISEPHAFLVLNAERPSMRARFIGSTNVHLWG
jgi:hypothetical protein